MSEQDSTKIPGDEFLVKREDIPPFAKFYKLFYKDAADKNPSFTQRLQAFTSAPMPKMAVVKKLYNKFLKFQVFDEQMAATSAQMNQNIGAVHKAMHSASTTTKSYATSLKQANLALSQHINPQSFKALTTQMLEKTADMQITNADLEQRLEEAQENMRAMQKTLEEIQRQSVTDALTDINNRKFFDQSINQAIAHANRKNDPLCLVMIDIDHFKNFNDTFGHQTGDQVIRLVAKTIQKTSRSSDIACRYGGEEFVVILPNTDLQGATILSNKVRQAIEEVELLKSSKNKTLGKITVSLGVAFLNASDDESSLISRADEALYVAKREGRNCVRTEDDITDSSASVA